MKTSLRQTCPRRPDQSDPAAAENIVLGTTSGGEHCGVVNTLGGVRGGENCIGEHCVVVNTVVVVVNM